MPTYINGKIHTIFPVELMEGVYAWDWLPTLSDTKLKLHLEIVNKRVEIIQRPCENVSIGLKITPKKLIISVNAKTQEKATTYIETIEYIVVDL